ncbi:MAG TPA: histidine kinase [Puia sp.]|nr:histidine kinase [Puia sp.]
MSFTRSVGFHLLAWSILFAGWYYFRVSDFPNHVVAVRITAVKILSLALLVYLTNYLLIPGLLYPKKYLLFAVVYGLSVFGIGILKIYINEQLLSPFFHGLDVFSDFRERVYDNIIPLFLLASTAAAMKLVTDYVQSQKRLAEISKEKAETELKFLKSQINPHFLFNSLNSVYFLIDKQNAVARETLLQFSDLLRYQLYECNADTIEIEKEIAYLKDYIHLQQLRKDSNYAVDLHIDNFAGFRVIPLLLIPFIENAFKHISHFTEKKNFIRVELQKKGETFYFVVENSKEDAQRSTEPKGGIGLANVSRRLDLLYPGRHDLQIHDANGTFKVELKLLVE